MFMDMDFPHPRKAKPAGEQKADYTSLVASATARQATSRTVSALLSTGAGERDGRDFIESRIAFFAATGHTRRNRCVGGAFWMSENDGPVGQPAKVELPVNLEGSTKGNAEERQSTQPEFQGTKWGTEL